MWCSPARRAPTPRSLADMGYERVWADPSSTVPSGALRTDTATVLRRGHRHKHLPPAPGATGRVSSASGATARSVPGCMNQASVGFHCPECAKKGAQKVYRGTAATRIPGRSSPRC